MGAAMVASGIEDIVMTCGVEMMSRVPMGSDGGALMLAAETTIVVSVLSGNLSAANGGAIYIDSATSIRGTLIGTSRGGGTLASVFGATCVEVGTRPSRRPRAVVAALRSCAGTPPKRRPAGTELTSEDPESRIEPSPISTPGNRTAAIPIWQPSPMVTSGPTTQKGPIWTPSPIPVPSARCWPG